MPNSSNTLKKWLRFVYRDIKLRYKIKCNNEKKLIIGSSSTSYQGWIRSDIEHLNLLNINDWGKYFQSDSIDVILAEHVWEHLEPDKALQAAQNCFRYLKPNGYLRIAVPDGYHPSPNYINDVKPGGTGAGADDHKVLYNYQTFSKVFSECGFNVKPVEWFDEGGEFHTTDWKNDDGYIIRSLRNDARNKDGKPNYTSIILDAVKK